MWLNHWYQWRFAHYCIIALSAPTFNSLSLNRLFQHPQLPSLITPWANTTAPRDTSRKGCESPCASRSAVVRPSRRESWRNGGGLRTQTLVPWAAGQGQPKQRHVAREGGTFPARASSWCSIDGILTRLAGEVQRSARDQVISSFWGKWRAGHGSSWHDTIGHLRRCWCVHKEGRVQHGWNWPMLASPSR